MAEGLVEAGVLSGRMTEMRERCTAATRLGLVSAAHHAALLAEVKALAGCIDAARQDIARLGVDELLRRDMPAVADELDAIVLHTAEATGTILDACERLEHAVAGGVAQPAVALAAAHIYEACSFQDITGQRAARVVQTLLVVESKIADILRVFGGNAPDAPAAGQSKARRSAMDQNAVDALLASIE